jgi:hypothetical protein
MNFHLRKSINCPMRLGLSEMTCPQRLREQNPVKVVFVLYDSEPSRSCSCLCPLFLLVMLVRQMRHIQCHEQIFTGNEISHRPSSTEEVEHSTELHHLPLALLCDASRHLVKNCLAIPCVVDLLVLDVLILAKVIVLALFHLHGIA